MRTSYKKNLIKRFALFFIVGFLALLNVCAEPTDPNVIKKAKLSDGKIVSLRLRGDEYAHFWINNKDGKKYRQLKENVWKQLEETDVSDMLKEARKKRAESSNHLSVRKIPKRMTGLKRVPVILVEFTDVKFEKGHDDSLFDRLLNEPGYKEGHSIGSVRDYFLAQSNWLLDLQFDVAGPVTLSNSMSYYAGENGHEHCGEMAMEACRLVDDYVDFSQYDWDGDGMVNQVFLIYAGHSQSTSGNKEDIWAHKSIVSSRIVQDGMIIHDYACSPELRSVQNENVVDGIGTFCHEFSHCLGLPDMYDGTNENYGTGNWDLMGTGCHNGNGYVPAGYTAFDKMYMGWQEPIVLNEYSEVTSMSPMSDGGDFYLIPNDNCENEYYLLENRQKTGWDTELPGHGMLITHIDYDEFLFGKNIVNRTGIDGNDHERCGIVLADNDKTINFSNYHEYLKDLQGDLWPYGSNNSLTNTSVPAATLFNRNIDGSYLLNKPVTSIMENGDGTMNFVFNNDFIGNPDNCYLTCRNDTLRFVSTSSVEYKITISNKSHVDYNRPIEAHIYKYVDGNAVEVGHDIITADLGQGEENDFVFNVGGLSGTDRLYITVEYYDSKDSQVRTKLCEKDFCLEDIDKFNVSVEDHNLFVTSKNSIQLDIIAHNESYYDFTTGIGVYIYKEGDSKAVKGLTLKDPIPSYGSKRLVFDFDGLEENVVYHANVYAAKMNETVDGHWSFLNERYYFVINDYTITNINTADSGKYSFDEERMCLYSIDGRQLETIDGRSIKKIKNKGVYIIKSLKSGETKKIVVK